MINQVLPRQMHSVDVGSHTIPSGALTWVDLDITADVGAIDSNVMLHISAAANATLGVRRPGDTGVNGIFIAASTWVGWVVACAAGHIEVLRAASDVFVLVQGREL